jgi:nitrate reductase / nitrite oxidoreductase, alpha subunit
MAEAVLSLSGTTNGELAVQGFRTLEHRVGKRLADLAEGNEEKRIRFADTQVHPVPVITSPEWSGSETGGRRYAPFTLNVERLMPWRTLTGRMHFFLDHDWMRDLGESLPIYRPPLDLHRLLGEPVPAIGDREVQRAIRHPHRAGRAGSRARRAGLFARLRGRPRHVRHARGRKVWRGVGTPRTGSG